MANCFRHQLVSWRNAGSTKSPRIRPTSLLVELALSLAALRLVVLVMFQNPYCGRQGPGHNAVHTEQHMRFWGKV